VIDCDQSTGAAKFGDLVQSSLRSLLRDIPRYSINAETSRAIVARIKYSPSPVAETAQVALSA